MKTALARLRAKTDQELSILIARELNRSLDEASRGNYEDAAHRYESVRSMLAVADLTPARREQIERSLAELRRHLARPAGAVA